MIRIPLPSIASIPQLRRLTLVFVCVAALAAPVLAAAQPRAAPPATGEAPNVPPPETVTPGEFNRMFEAYALLQAQNQLKLTDEQYADFIVRLRGLQEARRRHQQSRARLIQDLRRLTAPQNPNADEGAIRTALDALAREDASAHEEITRATAQVDEILDVRQRARFRVLEEQLERRKLDLLSRVRRPGAGAGIKARPPKS